MTRTVHSCLFCDFCSLFYHTAFIPVASGRLQSVLPWQHIRWHTMMAVRAVSRVPSPHNSLLVMVPSLLSLIMVTLTLNWGEVLNHGLWDTRYCRTFRWYFFVCIMEWCTILSHDRNVLYYVICSYGTYYLRCYELIAVKYVKYHALGMIEVCNNVLELVLGERYWTNSVNLYVHIVHLN